MGPTPATYGEKFADTRERIEEYLRGRKATTIKVSDIRAYLHGSYAEALIAPVLVALETEGLVECVAVEGKGGLVYFTELWYTQAPAKEETNV